MTDTSSRIVQKLWSYCNVLRDDGLSYQDYLEQLTFLLFLKMADERAALTGREQSIPRGYRWADLASPQMEGVKLEQHYRDTLAMLGAQGGMLGIIFEKAQNKIQDPAKLRQQTARCKRLRQSMLKWAFEGKLADQDPNDEAASVLLERIKAERAAATPTKKNRLSNGRPRKTA